MLDFRLIILEHGFKNVGRVFDFENTFTFTKSVDEGTRVDKAIANQVAFAFWHSSVEVAREASAIFVVDGAFAMRLVIIEVAFDNVAVLESKFSFAVAQVARPLALVVEVSEVAATVGALSFTLAFPIQPFSSVLHAALVDFGALPGDFTVLELASEAATIFHDQNTLTMFFAVEPLALVLEESVCIGVDTGTIS